MFKKKLLLFSSVACMLVAGHFFASEAKSKSEGDENVRALKRELELRSIDDSLLSQVKIEDLLDDEVYQKLAYEGWTPPEIIRIMKTALADKSKARMKAGYGEYAKRWLPDYGLVPGNDSLYVYVDSQYTEEMRKSIARTVPEDILNKYWEPLPYLPPKDRKDAVLRIPGYFRQPKFRPSCGRIRSVAVHPENPDRLYAYPDGAGLYKTDDLGEHWVNITDRIPNRSDRSCVNSYGIPVDPDDWDHVFGFMNNSTVYETTDGGESWRKIEGATHKGFKRAHLFRDKAGNLKFIGCTRGSNIWATSTVWVSEDTCKTWTAVVVPDSLKDIHAGTGALGNWFQEVIQDPSDRDKIYLPTPRSILYFDNGARGEIVNGQRVYTVKKLHFNVYDRDNVTLRRANHPTDMGADESNDAIFPCPSTTPGNLLINPNKADQWWFATGSSTSGKGNASAVFRSEDHGKTWTTLHDLSFDIGAGSYCAFGNALNDGWLGGFGVNFADTTRLYGCSTSSAKSFNGGYSFVGYGWTQRMKSRQPGDSRWIGVSAAGHNADNHFIASHKSGRVFRCSDGGMLCLDKDYNDGDWFNIGGDMGQMIFYYVAVNEFGDQTILGNTQDINGQTYRYGRWGAMRGYEGSEAWLNPYTSTPYLSGWGLGGFDAEYVQLDSWRTGFTKADVVTGAWFFTRGGGGTAGKTFNRCDDLGQTAVNLQDILGEAVGVVGKFALCRDKGRCTVYVITASNVIKRSFDAGNTFEPVMYNGVPVKFSSAVIATDPNNSDIFYLAQRGKVIRYYADESRWEDVGQGLPDIDCTQLMFHEGSGDLYFYHAGSAGIYILEYNKETGRYAPEWRFWVKGYNGGKSKNAVINYTTQEMVICDYGASVWCADLEHPSDRFFEDGFSLKECSFKDGRRTIGVDTEWTIPLYYYFKWTVNGEVIDDCPYSYLRRRLEPGDKVQLELTLRESPDVHTKSAVFVVPDVATAPDNEDNPSQGDASFDNPVVKEPGLSISSNGQGRVDLGYFDYFFNDFTIDFWVNPTGNGSLLTNTSRHGDPKGFEISVDGGNIKFDYYPKNVFRLPLYEDQIAQSASLRGAIQYSKWTHVAITHERYGDITIYIDGVKKASAKRILPEATLNNSVILSLFADAIERQPITAQLDELKIWSRALSQEEVRREMYSTNAENKDGLAAYWSFNGGSLENEVEAFSRHTMKPRVRAEVQYSPMNVPICAKAVAYETISAAQHTFMNGEKPLLGFSTAATLSAAPAAAEPARAAANISGDFGVYVYDATRWNNEEDNLDSDFYEFQPSGYLIHAFGTVPKADNVTVDFYPFNSSYNSDEAYSVYTADLNLDKQVWMKVGEATYNSDSGALSVSGVNLADIVDKKIIIVTTFPSVQITIDGLDADGSLPVYEEAVTSYPISAHIVGNLDEPKDVYNITPDGIVLSSGLLFENGVAKGELNLDLSKLGSFNTTVNSTLRSKDNPVKIDTAGHTRQSLIPTSLFVRNRITPRELGSGLVLDKATAEIGNLANYQSLVGKKEFTIMGWVRIDEPAVLTTANYSLMTWRDASNRATGLALENGKLLAVVNNTKMPVSTFGFTAEDLGNWVHVALIVREKKIEYYKNGIYYGAPKAVPAISTGIGPFCFGKNSKIGATTNADNFSGAFDQVIVWGRAIAQPEVFTYMYTAVPLNDPGLLLFTNMDYADRTGVYRDCYNDAEIKLTPTKALSGSAGFGEAAFMPYDSRTQTQWNDTAAVVSLQYHNSKNYSRYAVISTFRGTPHNFDTQNYSEYIPLSKEYYAITFLNAANAMYGDTVTIRYRNPIIMEGDSLAVGMRRIGTAGNLSGFVHGYASVPGIADFKVPQSFVENSTELMFFMFPQNGDPTGGRLANISLSFDPSIVSKFTYEDGDDVPVYMLEDRAESIPVVVDIIGAGRYHEGIEIVTDQKFAVPSQKTLDVTQLENRFTVNIDRDKINRYGMNEFTLDVDGVASAHPLKLRFYLEPYVHLSLVNGEHGFVLPSDEEEESHDPEDPDPFKPEEPDPEDFDYGDDNDKTPMSAPRRSPRSDLEQTNTFTAHTPVASLEIEAHLIEGFLPEGTQVEFEVTGDMPTALNIGNGSLLQEQNVILDSLRHHNSRFGSFHEGWNLVGNPYLTNINLTKEQNVDFNPDHITKFIYHCNPETGNYEVHDMTSYDADRLIAPFQSYFVQTTADNAELTITPVAKEVSPSKKTMAYTVSEKQEVTLALVADGKTYDHVSIIYDDNASDSFKPNEDAAKLWNLSGSSPELVAFSADNKPVSVSTVSASTPENVTLGVKTDVADRQMQLRCLAMTGFGVGSVTIHDNVTGEDWNPALDGDTYQFTAMSGTGGSGEDGDDTNSNYNSNRFTVTKEEITTSVTGVEDNGYRIYADDRACIVTGLKGNAIVTIFTPNGMKVAQTHTADNSFRAELETGVYIVTIRENGKDYTSKIMVQ